MQEAGRILLMPKGDYSADATYEMLDLVNHNEASWVCKKDCTGQEPSDSNTEFWQRFGTAVDLSLYATVEQMGMGARLSTSILEKALTLGVGVYNFSLDRGNYTGNDLPNAQYAYGMASVYRSTTTKGTTVILWGGMYDLPIAVNMHNGDAWFGWDALFTTAGGIVDSLTLGAADGEETKSFTIRNKERAIYVQVQSFGVFRVYDGTNGKVLFSSSIDGLTNAFNGTASGNLPLSGGDLTRAANCILRLLNTGTDNKTLMGFVQNGVTQGYIGFGGVDKPIVYSGNIGEQTLLHTGNKPIGTYAGNGSAEQRTIAVGGLNITHSHLLIRNTSYGFALVSTYGSIIVPIGGQPSHDTTMTYANGILTMATTNNVVNKAGENYAYQVL